MQSLVNRQLQIATACQVMAGYFALAATPRIPAIILVLPVVFLLFSPIGQWLERRSAPYRQVTAVLNVLYLLAIPLMLSRMTLIDTVAALVMYIQFYLLIHEPSVRSYRYLYLMSFFLLLAAVVQTPEAAIGLVMVFYIVSAVWALALLNLWQELNAARADNREVSGRIVCQEAGERERAGLSRSQLAVWMTVVVAGVFFFSIAVFVVTPRLEAGVLGRSDTLVAQTGLASGEVDLSAAGNIQENTRPVMQVSFPDEPGGKVAGELYWRVATYDFYSQSTWTAMARRGNRTPLPPYRRFDIQAADGEEILVSSGEPALKRVRQVIYYDVTQDDGLPALEIAEEARLLSASRRVAMAWGPRGDHTFVLRPRGGGVAVTYEVWSDIAAAGTAALAEAPSTYRDAMHGSLYRYLTNNELLPETRELAEQITAPYDTVFDKVQAIEEWFANPRNQFLYSLTYPPLPPEHPVDAFITRSRIGHCELFASAMALMVRSIGIPTRVVSGFRGGEWSDASEAYVVRSDMAHLWLEVYYIDHGWVRYDPSPSASADSKKMNPIAAFLSRQLLNAKILWYQRVLGYNREFQVRWLQDIGGFIGGAWTELVSGSTGEYRGRGAGAGRPLWGLILAGAGVLGIAAVIVLGLRGRGGVDGAPLLTPDQARAKRIYALLRRRLRRFGETAAGKTAEEVARAVSTLAITPRQSVLDALQVYNDARFGNVPLPQAEYSRLRRAIRRIRKTSAEETQGDA